MGELRKDYILNAWVIIAEGRKNRPHEFTEEIRNTQTACFFCQNHESETTEEIGRIGTSSKWSIRWFMNKYPIVREPEHTPIIKHTSTSNHFLRAQPAQGYHEVVVETPVHGRQLWDLSSEQITRLLQVYTERIKNLSTKKQVKYVCVFKNQGKKGGASLVHSHSQVVTTPFVPPFVLEKIAAARKFKSCPYKKIIEIEKKSPRFCFESKTAIAFCPFASRYNYELVIFPKRFVTRFEYLKPNEQSDCATLLQKALRMLRKLGMDYNFYLHYDPSGKNLRCHISLEPRAATWAGFELCSGIIVNSVSPEEAAAYYRS